MRWPWPRAERKNRLVVAYENDSFAYVLARAGQVVRAGLEYRGSDLPQVFAKRVRSLGLPADGVTAVLSPAQYQLLQIDAPAVPDEELKAAARWQIKGMVDAHIDDLTLDVMPMGGGARKGPRQMFVVVAENSVLRDVAAWTHSAGLDLEVIDIRDATQRNVQSALAESRGRQASANAALFVQGNQCLLTIVANGELLYSRRLVWQPAMPDTTNETTASTATAQSLDDAHIVDYGAELTVSAYETTGAARLVIELQRSIDMWDRGHPDQPLQWLVVHNEGNSQAMAAQLATTLRLPVEALDVDKLYPGLATTTISAATRAAVLPLLGALRRIEMRQP